MTTKLILSASRYNFCLFCLLSQSCYHTIVGTSLAQHSYTSLLSSTVCSRQHFCRHTPLNLSTQLSTNLKQMIEPQAFVSTSVFFPTLPSLCPCNLDRILCNCRGTRTKNLIAPFSQLAPKLSPQLLFPLPFNFFCSLTAFSLQILLSGSQTCACTPRRISKQRFQEAFDGGRGQKRRKKEKTQRKTQDRTSEHSFCEL